MPQQSGQVANLASRLEGHPGIFELYFGIRALGSDALIRDHLILPCWYGHDEQIHYAGTADLLLAEWLTNTLKSNLPSS
jgi:hypothetical protein